MEAVAEWIQPVPLVLIATDYAPYTDRPAPYGNVVWLDPYSDTTLLTTLSEAGLAVLHVRADLERTPVG